MIGPFESKEEISGIYNTLAFSNSARRCSIASAGVAIGSGAATWPLATEEEKRGRWDGRMVEGRATRAVGPGREEFKKNIGREKSTEFPSTLSCLKKTIAVPTNLCLKTRVLLAILEMSLPFRSHPVKHTQLLLQLYNLCARALRLGRVPIFQCQIQLPPQTGQV